MNYLNKSGVKYSKSSKTKLRTVCFKEVNVPCVVSSPITCLQGEEKPDEERDMYEELLTHDELQDNIKKINCEYSYSLVDLMLLL